ncbi:MAG: glycosyltransferase family 39 protein, partial [Candidatus Omnitrophica bacterium]|nr:glycosyltransferase family 39 protein [Candidatus Omnitrophota bacterium]
MITFKTAHDLTSRLVRSREFWAIFILSAIAFGLRFYRLGANDLWYDEVYSVLISRDSLAIWNPPVYFIILHYWIKLFGASEFALRFPSLVFSVLSIPMLYILGKMIFDRRAGFYAGLIMCLSSFHIWYAQEARPYSLSVFLSILTTYYLFRFLKEGKLVQGGLYAFFTVAGIYSDISHYYLFLLLIQLLAAVIFIKKNLYLRLFLVLCGVSLISALRLEFFISKFLYIKDGFWIPSPSLRSLIFTLENFNSGYNVPAWLYRFSDILVLAILAWSFVNYRKAQGKTMGLIVAGMLSFLPLGLAYVFSKVFFPIYLERAFIIFSPYYYLLIGFGINYIS